MASVPSAYLSLRETGSEGFCGDAGSPDVAGTTRVLLFASAREAVGAPQIDWPVPDEGLSVPELVAALVRRYPRLGPIAPHSRLLINAEYVHGARAAVRPGDEFAIHPPYSGG